MLNFSPTNFTLISKGFRVFTYHLLPFAAAEISNRQWVNAAPDD
jgi:hypothetical protein